MVDLQRVIVNVAALVLGLILGGWASWSFADTYPAQQHEVTGFTYAACAANGPCAAYTVGGANSRCMQTSPPSGDIDPDYPGTQTAQLWCSSGGVVQYVYNSYLWCPYGGSVSGTSCINAPACSTGQTRDPATGQCVASCTAGAAPPYDNATGSGVMPSAVCVNGCQFNTGWCIQLSNGTWACDVSSGTGYSCPTNTQMGQNQCPTGQCAGTFNGNSICLPCGTGGTPSPTGSQSTQKTTSSSTDPNGATTTGSTTTTTTTICGGAGSCTTTTNTSVTNASGTTTSQEQQQQPKEDLCASKPNDPLCKPQSGWSGSCGAFVCDGDAIQCAQAKAEWDLRCSMVSDDHTMSDLGTQVVADNDPQKGNFPWAAGKVQQETMQGQINQGRFLASSCVADWSVPMMGGTLTVPFSRWCDALTAMGYVVLTFSLIAAGRIVFGG